MSINHATNLNLKVRTTSANSVRTKREQRTNNARTAYEQRANYARTAYEQRANYERELTRELRDVVSKKEEQKMFTLSQTSIPDL